MIEPFLSPPSEPKFQRIEALIRSGDFAAAVSGAQEAIITVPESGAIWRLLHLALMGQGKFDPALTAIEEAIQRRPDNPYYKKLLAICLKENGKFDAALAVAEELYKANTGDPAHLSILNECHYRLGNIARAIEAGEKRLRLVDRESSSAHTLPIAPEVSNGKGKCVVSFCLWGDVPKYCVGAMANARLVKTLLPNWTPRFYLGNDVPDGVAQDLSSVGAETVSQQDVPEGIPRYLWRFLVNDDPTVDRFLCRDCDSRISPKEVAAIEEWMASGIAFHVMRDHVLHCDVILAGLWGGIATRQLPMASRIQAFLSRHGNDQRYGVDQWFLEQEIWPLIRASVLSHDSYYRLGETRPFPVGGKGDDKGHVGAGIVSKKALREEIARYRLPWPPDNP